MIQKPYKRKNVEIKSTTATIPEGTTDEIEKQNERKNSTMRTILLLLKGNVRNGFKCPNKSDKQ